MDVIKVNQNDIYRALHSATEYTFLSSAHGTLSRIDHILGHKTSPSIFRRMEIISSILSDYNYKKLKINQNRND